MRQRVLDGWSALDRGVSHARKDSTGLVPEVNPSTTTYSIIKKRAVIVSRMRRQPNGVERSHIGHALRWPGEFSTTARPALPEWRDAPVELRRGSDHALIYFVPSGLSALPLCLHMLADQNLHIAFGGNIRLNATPGHAFPQTGTSS